MTTLHKAAQAALEALEHCREAIVERGLNGSEEFAAKWGLTLPLESSAKAINDLRTALAQEPAQPKGLFVDLIDSLGPEFAAVLKAMDVPAQQPKRLDEDDLRANFEQFWLQTRGARKARRELVRHPMQPQTYCVDSANRHWVTWQASYKQDAVLGEMP